MKHMPRSLWNINEIELHFERNETEALSRHLSRGEHSIIVQATNGVMYEAEKIHETRARASFLKLKKI